MIKGSGKIIRFIQDQVKMPRTSITVRFNNCLILWSQRTPRIRLWQRMWNACKWFRSSLVEVHISNALRVLTRWGSRTDVALLRLQAFLNLILKSRQCVRVVAMQAAEDFPHNSLPWEKNLDDFLWRARDPCTYLINWASTLLKVWSRRGVSRLRSVDWNHENQRPFRQFVPWQARFVLSLDAVAD